MQDKKIELSLSKWFTSEDIYNKNIISSILFTGMVNEKNYTAYLLFDTFYCPKDYYINSIFLRIYLKELQTSLLWSNLYIEPFDCAIEELDLPNQQCIQCSNDQKCYKVKAGSQGWLTINLGSLICNDASELNKLKGLKLISEKKLNLLFIFNSNCYEDYKIQPKLIIKCSPKPHKHPEGIMKVQENNWKLDFIKNEISPIVNVERLNQGSFFINNVGNESISATIQVSGDSINWIDDDKIVIAPHNKSILISKYYGKFYRLLLSCNNCGSVEINFIYQYYK